LIEVFTAMWCRPRCTRAWTRETG